MRIEEFDQVGFTGEFVKNIPTCDLSTGKPMDGRRTLIFKDHVYGEDLELMRLHYARVLLVYTVKDEVHVEIDEGNWDLSSDGRKK